MFRWWVVLVMLAACRAGFDELPAASGDGGAGADGAVAGDLCTDTWCWERPPIVDERSLRAIGGSSATDVWAVGDGGTIRRWDGTAWNPMASPTNEALVAILVESPTNATIATNGGSVWTWTGSSWFFIGKDLPVAAFWRSPADVRWWAGEAGTFFEAGTARSSPATTAATALHGTTEGNLWYTGLFNVVGRWTGSSWVTSPLGDYPYAVWALTTGAAFVGASSMWSCTSAVGCSQVLAAANTQGMWGASDTDIWSVGMLGTIAHYDGASWTKPPSPTTLNLRAVWGSSATDVWAVGDHGAIAHYDGTSWSSVGTSSVPEVGWGALWVGDDDDRWIVGQGGTLWHSDGGDPVQATLPGGTASGDEVEGRAPNDVFALDTAGSQVLHFDGAAWTAVYATNGPPSGLRVSPTEAIVTTDTGNIATAPAGGTFTPSFASGEELKAACSSETGLALAVGRFSQVMQRVSNTWSSNTAPTNRYLLACELTGSAGYTVGGDAVIFYDNGVWSQVTSTTLGSAQSFNDVLVTSTSDVLVGGTNGRIVHFDGSTWSTEGSPTAALIDSFARSTTGTVYATGAMRGMLRRR